MRTLYLSKRRSGAKHGVPWSARRGEANNREREKEGKNNIFIEQYTILPYNMQ